MSCTRLRRITLEFVFALAAFAVLLGTAPDRVPEDDASAELERIESIRSDLLGAGRALLDSPTPDPAP